MTSDKAFKAAVRELAAAQNLPYTEARSRLLADRAGGDSSRDSGDTAQASDGHTGWACEEGASLISEATSPGAGSLPALHAVIYVCSEHQDDAQDRITAAGYDPDTRPAPHSHRWNPWPCGHTTAYDAQAADRFTQLATGAFETAVRAVANHEGRPYAEARRIYAELRRSALESGQPSE